MKAGTSVIQSPAGTSSILNKYRKGNSELLQVGTLVEESL